MPEAPVHSTTRDGRIHISGVRLDESALAGVDLTVISRTEGRESEIPPTVVAIIVKADTGIS